jgi:hypothetical protein
MIRRCVVSAVLIVGVAEAQVAPEVALRAAELFDRGIERRKSGDLEGACAAFVESQALAPALGTQLNVAMCLERDGKIEEARAMLQRTIEEAKASGDAARAQRASEDLAALEQRVAPPPPAVVEESKPPPPVPAIEIPTERLPIARQPPPPPPARKNNMLAIGLGAGAAVVMGVGVGTLVSAHGLQGDAERACPDLAAEMCDRAVAQDYNDRAVLRSRIGVGVVGAGVAIGAVAGYLWWRTRPSGAGERRTSRSPSSPGERRTSVAIAPVDGGGIVMVEGVMP